VCDFIELLVCSSVGSSPQPGLASNLEPSVGSSHRPSLGCRDCTSSSSSSIRVTAEAGALDRILYEGSFANSMQLVLMIFRLYVHYSLSFTTMDSFLKVLHLFLPKPNYVPRTFYRLRQSIEPYLPKVCFCDFS